MKDITEQDIKVFTEAVTDYFAALGEEAATVRTFYLSCGEAKEPVGDMTGIITVSGDNAMFYGGTSSLNGVELTITRLGA